MTKDNETTHSLAVDASDYARDPRLSGTIYGALNGLAETPFTENTFFLEPGAVRTFSEGKSVTVKDGDVWRHFHFPHSGKIVGPMIYTPAIISEDEFLRHVTKAPYKAMLSMIFAAASILSLVVNPYLQADQFIGHDPYSGEIIWPTLLVGFLPLLLSRRAIMACYFRGKHLKNYLQGYVEGDSAGVSVDLPKKAHSLVLAGGKDSA